MRPFFLISVFFVSISLVWIQGCAWNRKLFDLEEILSAPPTNLIPIAVIGSGPAGFSAGLYGAREGVDTVVFLGDKPGGLLTETTHVENWPAVTSEIGPQIMKNLQEQAEKFGAHSVPHSVVEINLSRWPFALTLSNAEIVHALVIVIATGAKPRYLGVPGEQEYWGKGVSSCAVCDAPFFQGEDVVVVGGGDSAVEEAMQLAHYANNVTILVRKPTMRASDAMKKLLKEYQNIQIRYQVKVQAIRGDGTHVTHVELVETSDGSVDDVVANGVFLAIGHIPNSGLVSEQVRLEPGGYIELTGRTQSTSVDGVYAAGDVTDHRYRQAGVASGDGIKAAMDALDTIRAMGYNDRVAHRLAPHLYTYVEKKKMDIPLIGMNNELEKLLNMHSIVMVDFYSINCPPCMQMLPIFAGIAADYEEKVACVKVSIDESGDLVTTYNVTQVPTLLVFKDKKLLARITAPLREQDFKELIDPLL
jgi:thioredoxin-disulfide reductase